MYLPRMLTLAAVLATAGPLAAAPSPTPVLRVTAIPEARDDFQKNEAVFTAWLGHETGVPVVLRLASSYEEAVQLLVSREADLGWLGGVTTVQVMTKTAGRVHPIVIREKDREFKSYVIAASSLGAGSLPALRGKRFTFGSPLSTSGHVMPRFFLLQQGLVPEKHFGSVTYSGDHKKTVLAVASGQQDCGAVNYKVFDQMVADKAVDRAKVEVVWTSPTFVDQSWVAARDLDGRLGPGVLQRIKAAYLALDASRPGDRRVLEILKTDRYVEAKAEWWRGVAAALSAVKLSATP
jgi:phosphonate transport system substrate-binding protein